MTAGPGPGAGSGAQDGRPVYGIDVGGTKVLGVALAPDGSVAAQARAPTPQVVADPAERASVPAGRDVAAAVADVVMALHRSVGDGPLPAVGVGIPGMLDRAGVLRFSPNLPGAVGADMRSLLAERLGPAPLYCDNDANCAALGELRLGAARGSAHCVVVTLGTGIGGGLIVTGRVLTGAHGLAGEIGHMVVDPAGPPCACGGRGCWERYASGGGLGRLAREGAFAGTLASAVALAGGDPERVRGEHVTRAALAGDPGALAVVAELGRWVAIGLANLVAVLDPERIVLGGGLVEAGEMLLAPVRAAYAELVEGGRSRPPVGIVAATLGERAGAIGAAVMARLGGMP